MSKESERLLPHQGESKVSRGDKEGGNRHIYCSTLITPYPMDFSRIGGNLSNDMSNNPSVKCTAFLWLIASGFLFLCALIPRAAFAGLLCPGLGYYAPLELWYLAISNILWRPGHPKSERSIDFIYSHHVLIATNTQKPQNYGGLQILGDSSLKWVDNHWNIPLGVQC